jgi:hypothetical protein
MTDQERYDEAVKMACVVLGANIIRYGLALASEDSKALAILRSTKAVVVPEGHHVYTSRFKLGDEAFEVLCDSITEKPFWNIQPVTITRIDQCFRNLFTREEAEAEVARRNQEQP